MQSKQKEKIVPFSPSFIDWVKASLQMPQTLKAVE
jgi:hypothetical protein